MNYCLQEIATANVNLLQQIGRLRFDVWKKETSIDISAFPNHTWLDSLDSQAKHWVATHNSTLIAAARLTLHDRLEDNPDGYLWINNKRLVPLPVAHLCKLVVHPSWRGQGLGTKLNDIRIQAAKELGAKSIIVTASAANAKLLHILNFRDTGIRATFSNRPKIEFLGLELIL